MPRRPLTARARGLLARTAPGIPRSRHEMRTSLQALATLRREGWQSSVGKPPVDGAGAPMPWLSYSAVRWLDVVLDPSVRMFEYGAGSSTAWFARPGRLREIVSVEHDASWHAQLTPPSNGELRYVPCTDGWWEGSEDSPYVRSIADGGPWDVVLIDGASRTVCARVAPHHLTPHGLVVLDDTDLATTDPAAKELAAHGLGRLDFWGFKPGVDRLTCTSVFGRDFNHWLLPRGRA
ncbi:class I SAM-dependent methyltransferase [Micromonospora mirobrigensis]|uniref:Methyltransferase domain-containing protein n=1 Tax=Micromonospora mirobrigensis TaxID=262898 RepID=A0A1C4U2Z8_9ACTN|nr:class I SAM-dependent methyltransferase [Micromonospora mirobrigensis]SCE66036.1 hypothetical protein GA0070564_101188 [Micromonospora mirobrigensis]